MPLPPLHRSKPGPWTVLLDFDGTLTLRDADFQIADALLPPHRQGAYKPVARAFEELRMSTRQYFEAYLGLLNLPFDAIARQARSLDMRPEAVSLCSFCREHNLDPRIVSEGLDVYIEPALRAAGLQWVPVFCNSLRGEPARPIIEPAPGSSSCPRCLSCKGAIARELRAAGRNVAIVGNGASDLCAAREAHLVLASGTLPGLCRDEGIDFVPWEDLRQVKKVLRRVCLDRSTRTDSMAATP